MIGGRISPWERILLFLASGRLACVVSGLCLSVIIALGMVRSGREKSRSYDAIPPFGGVCYVRDDIARNIENMDLKAEFNHSCRGVDYVCDAMCNKSVYGK
jgi:hypothetical protein